VGLPFPADVSTDIFHVPSSLAGWDFAVEEVAMKSTKIAANLKYVRMFFVPIYL
jgi:hypothetical protein